MRGGDHAVAIAVLAEGNPAVPVAPARGGDGLRCSTGCQGRATIGNDLPANGTLFGIVSRALKIWRGRK